MSYTDPKAPARAPCIRCSSRAATRYSIATSQSFPRNNLGGAPAFKDIVQDPPTTEREFIALWKLYLLCLIAELLREYDVRTAEALRVLDYLRDAKLIDDNRSSLTKLVKAVRDYARRLRQAEAIESGISFDPHTGVVSGLSGRIILGEPAFR